MPAAKKQLALEKDYRERFRPVKQQQFGLFMVKVLKINSYPSFSLKYTFDLM